MASRHSSRSTSTKSWFWNESNSWPQPQVIMLHVRAARLNPFRRDGQALWPGGGGSVAWNLSPRRPTTNQTPRRGLP
jgi:hypothetical protein